ncbi:Uncharacterised protein g11441 [Pycnogonum litorale]
MAEYIPERSIKLSDYSHQEKLLDTILPEMKWNSANNAIDIGAGPGAVSVEVLWPRLQRYGAKSLSCIDKSPDMVAWSKTNHSVPGIAFHEADIEKVESIPSEWIGKFDKAFSFYVIQNLKDFRNAFTNVHKLLKGAGEVGFLFESRSPLKGAQLTMLRNKKWKTYLQSGGEAIVAGNAEIYGRSDIEGSLVTLLKECGFEPKLVKEVSLDRFFDGAKEYKDFILAIDANLQKIPEEMIEEYTSDFYDAHVEIPYPDEEGKRDIVDPVDGSHVFFVRTIFLHAVKI